MREEQGFDQRSVYRQGVKEVLPLTLYPFLHLLLWTALVGFRIHDTIPSVHIKKLQWLVYSIIIYIRSLLIPLICLIHSIVCCRKKCSTNKQHPLSTTTSFTVPNEFTDQGDEHLIIRQGTKIPSRNYKSIFEGNTN